MRNIVISVILIMGLAACDNQDQDWPDYDFKSVYFPIQLPLRTLSLGEDRIDNTLDREYKFDIGVSIGGMYENLKDWTVDYVVDPSLTIGAFNGNGDTIYALPESYYTLSPENSVVIPSGSFNGLIRVQLTEQFFNDELSLTGQYVIPLRITGTSADSVLSGKAMIPDADRRVVDQWESGMTPKDWVLYGIKFVSAYHGNYLHRGMDIKYIAGVPTDTVVYNETDVENDLLTTMASIGFKSVFSNRIANRISKTGKYAMELAFQNPLGSSGPITISPRAGSNWAATGTGEFFDLSSSTETWTGLVWQSMHLNYSYNDGTNDHVVKDTLVFRDRGIKFELNTLVIR